MDDEQKKRFALFITYIVLHVPLETILNAMTFMGVQRKPLEDRDFEYTKKVVDLILDGIARGK